MHDSTTALVGLRSWNTLPAPQHEFLKFNIVSLQSNCPEYNKRAGIRVLSHTDNPVKIGNHAFSRLVQSLWSLAVLEELTFAVSFMTSRAFLAML
jgi:hypothetical protein